jgi:hypothetical protein
MDASHVWLRVEAPPDATVVAVGDDENEEGNFERTGP